MRNNPIIYFGVMLFAVCFWLLIHRPKVREDVPHIQTAVRQEIDSLSSSQESLRSLHLGPVTETYVVGSGDSMTGYFQFAGVYANQSCHVFVSWRKADTNTPIDKIKIGGTAKELRTIWSRKSQTDA